MKNFRDISIPSKQEVDEAVKGTILNNEGMTYHEIIEVGRKCYAYSFRDDISNSEKFEYMRLGNAIIGIAVDQKNIRNLYKVLNCLNVTVGEGNIILYLIEYIKTLRKSK